LEAFVQKCEAFVKVKRLLKDTFREAEAFFLNQYEDFINITRLFKDISREKPLFGVFIKISIILKTFSEKLRLFQNCEAF
jgi:hypothetical protein